MRSRTAHAWPRARVPPRASTSATGKGKRERESGVH